MKSKFALHLGSLFLGLMTISSTSAAEIVGVIAKVDGKATTLRDDREQPAQLYGYLYQGDRLKVSPDSSVTVFVPADGRTERFEAGETKVEAGRFNPSGQINQPKTKRAKKVLSTSVAKLQDNGVGGIVALRGARDQQAIEPIPQALILEEKPVFRWPGSGSQDYRLIVSRNQKQMVWHAKTSETEATYQGRPLEPGVPYHWKVTQSGGGEVASGTFTLASPEQRELAEDWSNIDELDDAVLLSVAAFHLFHKGMIAQAIRLFERIIELEPENGEYHLALGILYERAGRVMDAENAFQRAKDLGVDADAPTPQD